MLQRESMVLIREFNRRLRAAMRHSPNYMRLEATLEIESHILDVLNCRTSNLPEPDQVAEILRGFGSPEDYAGALMNQLVGAGRMSASSSFREITLASVDLASGVYHLMETLGRNVFHLMVTVARYLWLGVRSAWRLLNQLATWLRGPVAEIRAWLRIYIRKSSLLLTRIGRFGLRSLRFFFGLIHGAVQLLAVGSQLLVRLLRWTLRVALMVFLGFLALLAFGIAAFAAWAPDVVGWWVFQAQSEMALALDELRNHTVVRYGPSQQTAFFHTGASVATTALIIGLLVCGIVLLLVWNSRRRRGLAE